MTGLRRGLTLLEVIVALAVSALVVVILHQLVVSVNRTADHAHDDDRRWDAEVLPRNELRALVLNAWAGFPLRGAPNTARFASSCLNHLGLPRPCTIELQFGAAGARAELVALDETSSGPRMALSGPATLLYLRSAVRGGVWETAWSEPELPLAIGVALPDDTLILPVGIRR